MTQKSGLTSAIDDFGVVDSGLNLLVGFQPDCSKIDRALIDKKRSDRITRPDPFVVQP
jgi:EAL domain-containing protein (putative c-di-GMP-specific phosphodiesterase class I)